jgi:Trypsin-like peptidase domain
MHMALAERSWFRRVMVACSLCIASACGARDTHGVSPCARSDALLDGHAAPEAAFAAVGSLGRLDRDLTYQAFCSATLIAPDLVLTAKHCTTLARAPLMFALGANAKAPGRVVAVREQHGSEPQVGGVAQLGSDIAVARLDAAVTDIEPLQVVSVSPAELQGAALHALGYGVSDASCGGESAGLRRIGEQIVASVRGNVFDDIYGDYATYLAVTSGSRSPDAVELRYRHGWLLEGYEAWVEPGRGHAQICNGDSGGPLLRMSGTKPEVVGVSSWVWHSDQAACDHGAVIALIGPQTQQLLTRLRSAP